jgi:hypothetical protein
MEKVEKQKYPETCRFTSKYRKYKIFFNPPTTREIDGVLVRFPGNVLEFNDHECVCEDKKTIELALNDKKYYGIDYTCPEWEELKAKQKGLLNAAK